MQKKAKNRDKSPGFPKKMEKMQKKYTNCQKKIENFKKKCICIWPRPALNQPPPCDHGSASPPCAGGLPVRLDPWERDVRGHHRRQPRFDGVPERRRAFLQKSPSPERQRAFLRDPRGGSSGELEKAGGRIRILTNPLSRRPPPALGAQKLHGSRAFAM